MAAVGGEGEAGDQLGVSRHARHQLARVVVVDGERLVGAGGGAVDAGPVQHHLDQGPVLGGRPLERFGLLGAGHAVRADVAVLARRQDVLPGPRTAEDSLDEALGTL